MVNPRFHDPDKELLFLGFTGSDPEVGFSKKFGDVYTAIFYTGNLASIESGKQSPFWSEFTEYRPESWRQSTLRNNFALLIGLADMGFRLDARHNADSIKRYRHGSSDMLNSGYDKVAEDEVPGRGALALSWGANFGKLSPWVELAYTFGGRYTNYQEGEGFAYTEEWTYGRYAHFKGGFEYELADNRAFGLTVGYGHNFPEVEKYTGTLPVDNLDRWPWGDSENLNRRYGGYTYGADLYYAHSLEFDVLTLSFEPALGFGLTQKSNDIVGGSVEWADNADRWCTVDGGLSVGVEVRATNRIKIYSGATINVFDYTRWDEVRSGEDAINPAVRSAWKLTGMSIDVSSLGLGMTFSPSEKVTVGLKLNDLFAAGTVAATLKLSLGGN